MSPTRSPELADLRSRIISALAVAPRTGRWLIQHTGRDAKQVTNMLQAIRRKGLADIYAGTWSLTHRGKLAAAGELDEGTGYRARKPVGEIIDAVLRGEPVPEIEAPVFGEKHQNGGGTVKLPRDTTPEAHDENGAGKAGATLADVARKHLDRSADIRAKVLSAMEMCAMGKMTSVQVDDFLKLAVFAMTFDVEEEECQQEKK